MLSIDIDFFSFCLFSTWQEKKKKEPTKQRGEKAKKNMQGSPQNPQGA